MSKPRTDTQADVALIQTALQRVPLGEPAMAALDRLAARLSEGGTGGERTTTAC